jgi:hypothetical protein
MLKDLIKLCWEAPFMALFAFKGGSFHIFATTKLFPVKAFNYSQPVYFFSGDF